MTRFNISKEADLKSAILDYLQILENRGVIYYDRLNSGSLLVAGKGDKRYKVQLCKDGTSDIFFVNCGRIYFLECKRKGEEQRADQKEFQRKVEEVSAIYWVVDDFETFLKLMQEYKIEV